VVEGLTAVVCLTLPSAGGDGTYQRIAEKILISLLGWLADFNGDGYPDVVATWTSPYGGGSSGIEVWLNDKH
jgi:hypothetical protein